MILRIAVSFLMCLQLYALSGPPAHPTPSGDIGSYCADWIATAEDLEEEEDDKTTRPCHTEGHLSRAINCGQPDGYHRDHAISPGPALPLCYPADVPIPPPLVAASR